LRLGVLTWTSEGPGPGVEPALPKERWPFTRRAAVSARSSPSRLRRAATLTGGSQPASLIARRWRFALDPSGYFVAVPKLRIVAPDGFCRTNPKVGSTLPWTARSRMPKHAGPYCPWTVSPFRRTASLSVESACVHRSARLHFPNGFSLPVPKDRLALPWAAQPHSGRSLSRLAARRVTTAAPKSAVVHPIEMPGV
jgi:hypothetical protein